MKKVFISYDENAGYPQPAQFGRGKGLADGTHIPPAGLTSFSVDLDSLALGTDEELYEVTAPDTLAEKSQADRDAILLEKNKPGLVDYLSGVISAKVDDLGTAPVNVNDQAAVTRMLLRGVGQTRKESKGRPNADTTFLDQIEGWFDSVNPIYEAGDLIQADILAGVITTKYGVLNSVHWPT